MKFCWCTLMVRNMDVSLKFYQDIVGLPLVRRFKAENDSEYAFLGEGETQVELICNPSFSRSNKLQGISLGFVVGSLDEQIKFVRENGLEVESGPFQPSPHIKFFFVKDPDGMSIQFVENM